MNPVVAVIAPGMMGAAVGARLADHGLKVLTSLEGRSAETRERAKAARMTPASDEEIGPPISFFPFCRRAMRSRLRNGLRPRSRRATASRCSSTATR